MASPWKWILLSWVVVVMVVIVLQDSPHSPEQPRRQLRDGLKPLIRFESHFEDYSSFASVARGIVKGLEHNTKSVDYSFYDLSERDGTYEAYPPDKLSPFLVSRLSRHDTDPDAAFVIRFKAPPRADPKVTGRLIQYVPWEFVHIPTTWVEHFNEVAHEVWVPSGFVREGYIASGVRADKVHVIPHGINIPQACRVKRPCRRSSPGAPFVFLFDSGFLWRKGIDLLVEAYLSEFTREDNVLLVLHSIYGLEMTAAYVESLLSTAQYSQSSPDVYIVGEALPADEYEEMRSIADAYVHPARSEGFGMTVFENMACGIPTIVPDIGAHAEFIPDGAAYLVKSTLRNCSWFPCVEPASEGGTGTFLHEHMDLPPMWAEVDVTDLGRVMRQVHTNRDEACARGEAGRQHVAANMTWDTVSDLLLRRLQVALPNLL